LPTLWIYERSYISGPLPQSPPIYYFFFFSPLLFFFFFSFLLRVYIINRSSFISFPHWDFFLFREKFAVAIPVAHFLF
jgi:hypothetical protein